MIISKGSLPLLPGTGTCPRLTVASCIIQEILICAPPPAGGQRTGVVQIGGSGALGFGQPESLSVVRARSDVAGPIRGRPSGRPL